MGVEIPINFTKKPEELAVEDILKIFGKISQSGLLPRDEKEIQYIQKCMVRLNRELSFLYDNINIPTRTTEENLNSENKFSFLMEECEKLHLWRPVLEVRNGYQVPPETLTIEFFSHFFNESLLSFDHKKNPVYSDIRQSILANPLINIAERSNEILTAHLDEHKNKYPDKSFLLQIQIQRRNAIAALNEIMKKYDSTIYKFSNEQKSTAEKNFIPPLPANILEQFHLSAETFEAVNRDKTDSQYEIETLKAIDFLRQLEIGVETNDELNKKINAEINKILSAYENRIGHMLDQNNLPLRIQAFEQSNEKLLLSFNRADENKKEPELKIITDEMIRRLMNGELRIIEDRLPDSDLRNKYIHALKDYCKYITPFIGSNTESDTLKEKIKIIERIYNRDQRTEFIRGAEEIKEKNLEQISDDDIRKLVADVAGPKGIFVAMQKIELDARDAIVSELSIEQQKANLAMRRSTQGLGGKATELPATENISAQVFEDEKSDVGRSIDNTRANQASEIEKSASMRKQRWNNAARILCDREILHFDRNPYLQPDPVFSTQHRGPVSAGYVLFEIGNDRQLLYSYTPLSGPPTVTGTTGIQMSADVTQNKLDKIIREKELKTRILKSMQANGHIAGVHQVEMDHVSEYGQRAKERYGELISRHNIMRKSIEIAEHAKPDAAINPRAAYLADISPYALRSLVGKLNGIEQSIDPLLFRMAHPIDYRNITDDIRLTRQEIAISMLERLKCEKENKTGDLVGKMDEQKTKASEVYALTDNDIRDYCTFIKKYGDAETEKRAQRVVGNGVEVIAARSEKKIREAYEKTVAFANIVSAAPGEIRLPLPPAPNVSSATTVSEVIAQYEDYREKVRKIYSPLRNDDFHFIDQDKRGFEELQRKHESIIDRRNQDPVFITARLRKNNADTALSKHRQEGEERDKNRPVFSAIRNLFFGGYDTDKWPGEDNKYAGFLVRGVHGFFRGARKLMGIELDSEKETRLRDELQQAQKNLSTIDEDYKKALAENKQEQEKKLEQIKVVVDFRIANIRDAIIESQSPSQSLAKQIEDTRSFILRYAPERIDEFERKIDFCAEFINGLQNEKSLDELRVLAELINKVDPQLGERAHRILTLLSGESPYASQSAFEADLQVLIDATKTIDKNINNSEAVISSIKGDYLDGVIDTKMKNYSAKAADSDSLRKILDLYTPEEQKEKMQRYFYGLDGTMGRCAYTVDDLYEYRLQSSYLRSMELTSASLESKQMELLGEEYLSAIEKFQNLINSLDPEEQKAIDDFLKINKMENKADKSDYAYWGFLVEMLTRDDFTIKNSKINTVELAAIKAAAKEITIFTRDLSVEEEELKKMRQLMSDSELALTRLQSDMTLFDAFRNADGFTTFRDQEFESYFNERLDEWFGLTARPYTPLDFELDVNFFQLAESLQTPDEKKSGASTVVSKIFNTRMSDELSKNPPTIKWSQAFACLVEKYGSDEIKEKYRMFGLEKLGAHNAGYSREAAEVAYVDFLLTQRGDLSYIADKKLPDAKEGFLPQEQIERIVSEYASGQEASWMHEVIVRELGTEEQLQNMHAEWMFRFLGQESAAESVKYLFEDKKPDETSEGTHGELVLRELLAELKEKDPEGKLTREQLAEFVGEKNVDRIQSKLADLIAPTDDAAKKEKVQYSGDVNVIQLMHPEAVGRIRKLGGEVGDDLVEVFEIEGNEKSARETTVIALKAQHDLAVFAKEYYDRIMHEDVLEMHQLPEASDKDKEAFSAESKESGIAAYFRSLFETHVESNEVELQSEEKKQTELEKLQRILLMSPDERDREAGVTRSDAKKRYEYDYSKDPAVFYESFLLPVQEIAIRNAVVKLRSLFVMPASNESSDLHDANTVEQLLSRFEERMIAGLTTFGDQHIKPIISKVTSDQSIIVTPAIPNANELEKKLGQLPEATALVDCKEWVKINKSNPNAVVIGHYIQACENANRLRNEMSAAHDCLEIERRISTLSQHHDSNVDIISLIEKNQTIYAENNTFKTRLYEPLNALLDSCKNDIALDVITGDKIEQVEAAVEMFGTDAQKKRFASIVESYNVLNNSEEFNIANVNSYEESNLYPGLIVQLKRLHPLEPEFAADASQVAYIINRQSDEYLKNQLKEINTKHACDLITNGALGLSALSQLLEDENFLALVDHRTVRDAILKQVNDPKTPINDAEMIKGATQSFIMLQLQDLWGAGGKKEFDILKNEKIAVETVESRGGVVTTILTMRERSTHEAQELVDEKIEQSVALVEGSLALEEAQKAAKKLLDAAFCKYPNDYFLGDASLEVRQKNESDIIAAFQLLKIARDPSIETYRTSFQELIYPNFLKYVVYREGDQDENEQKKFFRYSLFEAVHLDMTTARPPESLRHLSKHREDNPDVRQQFFHSHSHPGKEFIAYCEKEWGALSMDQLLKAGCVDRNIARRVRNEQGLVVTRQHTGRELALEILIENAQKMNPGPEKIALEKIIEIEKRALCVQPNLIPQAERQLRNAITVGDFLNYDPIKKAVTLDSEGKLTFVNRDAVKDPVNKIKYDHVAAVYKTLYVAIELIRESSGFYSEIKAAFKSVYDALDAAKNDPRLRGEQGGKFFTEHLNPALAAVKKAEKEWEALVAPNANKLAGVAPPAKAGPEEPAMRKKS